MMGQISRYDVLVLLLDLSSYTISDKEESCLSRVRP